MNDKVPHHMALSVELAGKQRAKNRALHEVRHAIGVSIVGAICGASPISKRGPVELRVVLEAIKVAWDHAEHNLNEIDNAAWKEANDELDR